MTTPVKSYLDYDHPSQISDDSSLTEKQKTEFLNSWAVEEEAIARANGEGMSNPARPPKLRRVRKALAEVEAEKETKE